VTTQLQLINIIIIIIILEQVDTLLHDVGVLLRDPSPPHGFWPVLERHGGAWTTQMFNKLVDESLIH